jgi:anti-sigma-K factor RskA
MNSAMEDDHSLLGPYAVGALDQAERAAFERHLASCASCSEEAAQLADAAASLADAAAVRPPVSLRATVFAEVARVAQATPSSAPLAAATSATPRAVRVARRRWPLVVTAAASLVAIAGVGIAFGTRDSSEAVSALERDIMMLSSAPDAHSMDLGIGSSHLVVSSHMDEVAVMGHSAPMPADGMEYQLWMVMADGSAVAGPTFMPDKSGDIMTISAVDVDSVKSITVTEEPRGGSSSPTGEMVASLDL